MTLDDIKNLIENGEYPDAMAAVTRFLAGQPGCAEAYAVRGDIKRVDDPDGAREDYQAALKLDPDCAPAYSGLGWLAPDEEALKLFTVALSKDAQNTAAMCGVAGILLRQGQSAGALEYLNKAVSIAPDSPELYRARASLLSALPKPDWAGAFRNYSTALDKLNNKRNFMEADSFFSAAIRSRNADKAADIILPILKVFPLTASLFDFLVYLAGQDDPARLELFFQNGLSPNAALPGSDILFHRFIAAGQRRAVELCIKYKADFTLRRGDGATPLSIAVIETDDLATGKILLKHCASPLEIGASRFSPLADAIRMRKKAWFDLLLSADVDVNVNLPYSPMTYLQFACTTGDVYFVKRLLDKGADPAFTGGSGVTPLEFLIKLKKAGAIADDAFKAIAPRLKLPKNTLTACDKPFSWPKNGTDPFFLAVPASGAFPWGRLLGALAVYFLLLILGTAVSSWLLVIPSVLLLGALVFFRFKKKRQAAIAAKEYAARRESVNQSPLAKVLAAGDEFTRQVLQYRETLRKGKAPSGFQTLPVMEKFDATETQTANRNLSWQIYLLWTMILARRIPMEILRELREYYVALGADIVAFDRVSGAEIIKAFLALYRDAADVPAALRELESAAAAYAELIAGTFEPEYDALAHWGYSRVMAEVTAANCFELIGMVEEIARNEKFHAFASIPANLKLMAKTVRFFEKKIKSKSAAEWEQIKLFCATHPNYLAALYQSAAVKKLLQADIVNGFRTMCEDDDAKDRLGEVNFELPYLAEDIDSLENRLADISLEFILTRPGSRRRIVPLIETLHRYGLGYAPGSRLFTLCNIMPFVVSGNPHDRFRLKGLMVEKADVPCPRCGAFGYEPCPACSGSGKMPCPECGGRGEVPGTRKVWIMCMKCGGRGRMTCTEGCRPKKGPDGETRRYVDCSVCKTQKYMIGGKTAARGELTIRRGSCFFRTEDGVRREIAFPVHAVSEPYRYLDEELKQWIAGASSVATMSTASGERLYLDAGAGSLDESMLIELLTGCFFKPVERKAEKKGSTSQFSENEQKYIAAYRVAAAGGAIDDGLRALLNFQANSIFHIAPERVAELENDINGGER